MKRIATALLVLATWPLLTAGGGVNPPAFSPKADNQSFSATIVLDPHMAAGDPRPDGTFVEEDATPPSSKHAYVFLRSGGTSFQTSFKILPSFALFLGCQGAGSVNDGRFLYTTANPTTMRGWVPPLALQAMFQPFGVTPSDTAVPAITRIDRAACVPDPLNTTTNDGSVPGHLVMDVTIQILVPAIR